MWIEVGVLLFLLQRKMITVSKSPVWGRNEMKAKKYIFSKQTKKEGGSTKKKIGVAKCRKFMWKEKIAVKKKKINDWEH